MVVLENLEKIIKENNKIIEELLEIDNKYNKTKIDVNMLIEIIQKFKDEKIDKQGQHTIKIIYNGNPCITMNLCILAILTQNIIILDWEESFQGINTFIIQTINNLLTHKLVSTTKEAINVEKIIVIDDINKYNNYLCKTSLNIKFYSLNYINFYSDCDEYEEIKELIYKYANENQIPIESYSELELEEAIQMIKSGEGKIAVVLTKNNETKQKFKEKIKNKELYINKNPFKENIRLINKEIFNM